MNFGIAKDFIIKVIDRLRTEEHVTVSLSTIIPWFTTSCLTAGQSYNRSPQNYIQSVFRVTMATRGPAVTWMYFEYLVTRSPFIADCSLPWACDHNLRPFLLVSNICLMTILKYGCNFKFSHVMPWLTTTSTYDPNSGLSVISWVLLPILLSSTLVSIPKFFS